MDEDGLGQVDDRDPVNKLSEDQLGGDVGELSDPTPQVTDEDNDDFDLGVLEPPLPIDDEVFSEPSKLRLFLRRLLRWSVAVLVIFAFGVGATWISRVAPLQKEIDDLELQIEDVSNQADLSASEVESLRPLVDEVEDLKVDLSKAELHIEILKIRGDVASAHLAMLAEDIVTAKASLAGTDSRLEVLRSGLEGEDRDTVQGMLTRLDLVLEELGEDTFAAIRDLEVLSSNLAALERSLFGN